MESELIWNAGSRRYGTPARAPRESAGSRGWAINLRNVQLGNQYALATQEMTSAASSRSGCCPNQALANTLKFSRSRPAIHNGTKTLAQCGRFIGELNSDCQGALAYFSQILADKRPAE